MPVGGFGWSAGDIVKAISILKRLYKALEETGGAVSQYQVLVAHVKRYILVLNLLREFRSEGLDQSNVNAIASLASVAYSIITKFDEDELRKYELALAKISQSRISGVAKKAQYTFDMPEKVPKLLQNLGIILDKILVLMNMSVLKQGESILKEQSLIKNHLDTLQSQHTDLRSAQEDSYLKLIEKLNELVNMVSSQVDPLQLIQTVQCELRDQMHGHAELQARQDQNLERMATLINEIRTEQIEFHIASSRHDTENAEQRRVLERIEASVAEIRRYSAIWGTRSVTIVPQDDSTSTIGNHTHSDRNSSHASSITHDEDAFTQQAQLGALTTEMLLRGDT